MGMLSQENIDKINIDIMNQPEDTRPTATEVVSNQIDGVTPKEDLDGVSEEDISYVGDALQGLGYGAVEGFGNMYELGQWAGNSIEEASNEYLGTDLDYIQEEEFVNPLDAPKTLPGQLASGVSQLATGFIPGLGILKIGGGILKAGANLGSLSTTITKGATNLLASSLGKKAVSVTTSSAMKLAGTTALAEQLVFDPRDPRLADLAYASDIPIVKDIGNLLKANEGDSTAVLRIKMAAEGFGIGVAVDKGISGLTFLGRTVKNRLGKGSAKGDMTIDELEELSTQVGLPEGGGELGTKATEILKQTLKEKGYDTAYIDKYIGSINLTKIQSSQWETYNLINETGQALKEIAESKGKKWPPVKGNKKSLEEASTLLGHNNIDTMTDVLKQNESVMKMSTTKDGAVTLGAGLEGATAYALAARQVLLNQVDVTFALAKEIKDLKANIKAGKSTDTGTLADMKASYVQQLLTFETIQSTVNGIANESGRLLQSFNVNLGNAKKATFLDNMLKAGGDDIDSLIDQMGKGEAAQLTDKIKMFSDAQKPEGAMARIKAGIGEYWYNSILSAPDTQAVNILGNLGVQLMRTVVDGSVGAVRGNLRLLGGWATGKKVDPASVMVFGDVWQRVRGMTYGKRSASTSSRIADTADKLEAKGYNHPAVLDSMILNIKRGLYKGSDGSLSNDVEDVLESYDGGFDALYQETKDKMIHDYGASVTNFAKTAKLAFNTLKLEVPPDARYSRYEIGEAVSNRAIPTIVGRFVRLPTTTMGAFDTFFKSIADNAALYEAAYKQVRAIRYEVGKKGGSYTMDIGSDVTIKGAAKDESKKVIFKDSQFTIPGTGKIDPETGKIIDSVENLNASEMIEYLVANPTQRMLKEAEQEMLEATFQQQNAFTEVGEYVRRLLDKSGIGLGTALMPFVRTPLNLLAYTLDRTPAGLYSKEARENRKALNELEKVSKSKMTGTEAQRYRRLKRQEDSIQAKRLNRQIVGATYLTGAYHMAQTGMITGGGPTDYTERKRLESTGWRAYSYRVKEGEKYKYYPISRLDPFSQMAALAADFQFITNELAQAELTPAARKDVFQISKFVLSNMGESVIKMIGDKTYLKSMGEIVDAIYAPRGGDQGFFEKLGKTTAKVSGSVMAGAVPNILSRTAEAFAEVNPDGTKQSNYFYDPVIQDAYIDMSMLRLFAIKATSKIPGVRDALADFNDDLKFYPRINEFGSTMDRERTASVLAGTAPSNRSYGDNFTASVLGDSFVSRPGHREDTADISTTLASLRIEEKRTKNYLTIPGTSDRIKLKPVWYYKLSLKEGLAYRQGLEELFESKLWKGTEESLRKNPRDKETVYNTQRDLINNVKKAVVTYYAAELLHPDILEDHGVDKKRMLDAFAKEQTLHRKEYFLQHNKLEEGLR
tara:strand:- start:92 stop:4300 length:4209 start_codon:yes stop_codon:yes gene_type:complete